MDENGKYRLLELRNRNPVFNRSNRPNLFFPLHVNPDDDSVSLQKTVENHVEVFPRNTGGEDGCWRWSPPKVSENLSKLIGYQVSTGAWRVFMKDCLTKNGSIATTKEKTIWLDKEINNENGKEILKDMFNKHTVSFPKSPALIEKCISIGAQKSDLVLDYFAGSGTTAHAVINLNSEDKGSRKYILVEMGDYFNTVLVPRIKKAIYSKDWKNGEPVSREGVSHMLKYIHLESYEDALNNLEMKRTEGQESLLAESESFRESYMISYMLDVETKNSPSLLSVDAFMDPFNYKLKTATGGAGETKPVSVDLVETFSYLLGLTVHHIDHIRGFRVVQGTSPEGGKVLVIWRNLKEKSNEDLEKFFRKQEYNPKDMEFDLIYVNGDNNLENIRRPDETWKVRLIEEDFKRLMFEVEDI